ncbi:helicase-associated domain-containing protein [Microlunatus panaciterrae]|uniref:Helicase XPB/Ssl2 N-terminal domain-containing protein n=1 Tax=Microlunatus panaciterrae TaxID=400768 RepID=A0ABS2RGS4_9ACTN|nr:helicase-associated domain-containing protein [Microlunatus panaciterrae]MBM7798210.1 hypothetical protein [Microlunatus panaciterrae]
MAGTPRSSAPSPPRTLTEALRAFDQARLVALLDSRPDLCYPLPRDLADLAARAATSTSTGRAIDHLDAWGRHVCETLAALPDPATTADVAVLLLTRDPDATAPEVSGISRAIGGLRDLALCWGPDDQLHLVRAARDFFGPFPGGLAPPSPNPLRPEQIDAALRRCGDDVAPVLERLAWGPPTGAVRNATRAIAPETAVTPVERLLAHRLLRPLDSDTVILPREVALHVRGGRFVRQPVPLRPPELTGRQRAVGLVDKAAAGGAFGLLHDLELVAHTLEHSPHRLLRTGGMAARDITALGRNLGTDPRHATFVVECLAAAGLVAPGDDQTLLPTAAFDRWIGMDAAPRWQRIVDAWVNAQRWFSAAATEGAHALGDEATAAGAPALRRLILQQAERTSPGTVVSTTDLAAVVGWYRPRLAGSTELNQLVGWTWQESSWLGLVALDVFASFAAVALQDHDEVPASLLELFPTPVDQFIVQADLTAVAPGPLPHAIASQLRMLADQESRGGGGVFRFSAASIRRALDAGWAAADIHSWLSEHSATPVPQPLAYLVDDVARLHGSVRVGSVVSYIRTDETHAATILANPGTAALGLRALAPGVLVSLAEPDEVVETLRRLGLSPSAEDSRGRAMTTPARRRAPAVRRPPTLPSVSAGEAAAAVIAAERQQRRGAEARISTDETLARLTAAAQSEGKVRVVYVASDGTQAERDLSPLGLGAGHVRAVDLTNSQVVTIPLARISAVRPATSDDLD